MALTFVQLQNKVLSWLDEGTTTDADEVTLAQVQEAIVEADVMRVGKQRWPFMRGKPATLSLVPGTRIYTLDPTFHTAQYFWNASTKSPLVEYDEDQLPTRDFVGGLVDDYYTSNPMFGGFVLRGQELELLWTPTSADTLTYGFYKLPVEMSVDADLPNIPYPHSRVLIYDALIRMATYNEDLAAAKLEEWGDMQKQFYDGLVDAHGQPNSDQIAADYVVHIPRD